MDPNATLAIMRQAIAAYRETFDGLDHPERYHSQAGAEARLIDLGDTLAEAAGALDEWLAKEGSIPEAWGRCW